METGLEKACTKCGALKDIEEFYVRPKRKGGRHPWCRSCYQKSNKDWVKRHPEHVRKRAKYYTRRVVIRLHALVFRAYCDGDPFCECCGEREERFLTIDHVNNDGKEHRKTIGEGAAIYRWLVKHNFPSGFQVFCWNCQMGKKFCGECPHRLNKEKTMESIYWKPFTAASRKDQLDDNPKLITTFRKGTKWLRPDLVGQRVQLVDEKDHTTFATAEVFSVKATTFGKIDQIDHDRQSGDMTPENRLEIMRKVYGDYGLDTVTTVLTLGNIEAIF